MSAQLLIYPLLDSAFLEKENREAENFYEFAESYSFYDESSQFAEEWCE
jgi:hypothetical protein